MYATIMTIVAILAIICCLIEAWLLIEAGRELDKREESHREDRWHATRLLSDSTLELEEEIHNLKEKNDRLREQLAEMEGWLEPDCTCHYEETCAGFPEHNMTNEEMAQEMRGQYEEQMKAEEARRMAADCCPQCGKRGGCYCNGMTPSGEIFRPSDDIPLLTNNPS